MPADRVTAGQGREMTGWTQSALAVQALGVQGRLLLMLLLADTEAGNLPKFSDQAVGTGAKLKQKQKLTSVQVSLWQPNLGET